MSDGDVILGNMTLEDLRASLVRPVAAQVEMVEVTAKARTSSSAFRTVRNNEYITLDGDRWQAQNASKPHSLGVRRNTFRFELRPGDQWLGDAKARDNRERSQIYCVTKVPFLKDEWFAVDFTMSGGTIVEPGVYLSLISYHQTEDPVGEGGFPGPFTVRIENGNLEVVTRHTDEEKTVDHPVTAVRHSEAFVPGKTYKFVARIQFGRTEGGLLDFWIDGIQVVGIEDRIGYNDKVGTYMKFGVYRGGGLKEPLVATYANLERGPSSLASRVGSAPTN